MSSRASLKRKSEATQGGEPVDRTADSIETTQDEPAVKRVARDINEDQETATMDQAEQEAQDEGVAKGDGDSTDTTQDYGAHYRVLLQALEVAVRKGANRWT